MSKKSTKRRLRRLGCVIFLVVLIGVLTPILHYAWPAFVYPPLLLSLPAPPGYVPESLHFGGAGLDFRGWKRIYDVDQPYEEVVDFFKTKLARRGWELTMEEKGIAQGRISKRMLPWVELVFHGPYFLSFDIQIRVIAEMEQGEQIGTARVFIYDEPH